MLALFHLDQRDTVERAKLNYVKIYGGRSFKKNDFKRRVALAFSICNTLIRLKFPRPPEYITQLLGLDSCKPLLNIPKTLNFNRKEFAKLDREDYELQEVEPQHYIDTLCAHLDISFPHASKMYKLAEKCKWQLHGKYPTVIAAAVMQHVYKKDSNCTPRKLSEICEALSCRQKSVNKTVLQLQDWLAQRRRRRRRRRRKKKVVVVVPPLKRKNK